MNVPVAGRGKRRWKRWTALALAAVAAGSLGAGFFPQEALRRWAERRLQSSLGPACRIGHLHVVPALLAVYAERVDVDTGRLRLHLPRLYVRLAPATILGRAVVISSIAAGDAEIAIDLGVADSVTTPPATAPSLPVVIVRRMALRDARVRVRRDGRDLLRLSHVTVEGALGAGTLRVQATDIDVAGRALDGLRGELSLTPQLELSVHSVEITRATSRVELSGGVRFVAPVVLWNIEALGDLGLADLLPDQAQGRIRLAVKLSGSDSSIREADARVDGDALTIGATRIDRLAATLNRSREQVTNGRLVADVGRGSALLRARMGGNGMRVDLQVNDIPLARLVAAQELPSAAAGALISGALTAVGDIRGAVPLHGRLSTHASAPGQPEWTAAAELAGTLRSRDRSIAVDWNVTAETLRVPEHSVLRRGRLSLDGTATGAWPPRIASHATAAATLALPGGTTELALRATAESSPQRLFDAQGDVSVLGGQIVFSAQSDSARRARVLVQGHNLDLAFLAPDLRGRAQLSLSATGPLPLLRHSSQVSLTDVSWRGAPFHSLTFASEGVARRASLTLAAPALQISGSGDVDFGTGRVLTSTIILDRSPLAPFAPMLSRPIEGQLSGQVHLRLPLDHPQRATIQSQIESSRVVIDTLSLALARPLRLTWDAKGLALDELALTGEALRLAGRLRINRGATRIDLAADFDADLSRLPVPAGWDLAGRAAGALELSGATSAPTGSGHIRLTDARIRVQSAPEVLLPDARADIFHDTVQLAAPSILLAGGTISADGRFPLRAMLAPRTAADTGTLDLSWHDVELARLLEWLRPGQAAPLHGTLAGHAHIDNPLSSLSRVRATLDLPEIPLRSEDVALVLGPATLRLADGHVRTEALPARSAAGSLTLRGAVDLIQRRLAITTSGKSDLRALSPFLTDIALAGTATLDVKAEGSFDQPSLFGSLDVRDASLRLRDFRQPLTDLTAHLTFDRTRVTLVDGSAMLGGGTLQATGEAQLHKLALGEVRVALEARDVALRYPQGLRTRLDGELELTGRPGALLLAGRLRVLRGLYTENLATESAFASVAAPVVSPRLRAMRLDIDVATEAPLLVRNDVARLGAEGRLSLRGDMEVPRPFGRFAILPGGRLYLQGRELTIESGGLAYDGTWVPTLSLVGTTPIEIIEYRQEGKSKTRQTTLKVEANGTVLDLSNAWAARIAGNSDASLDQRLRLSTSTSTDASQADLATALATGSGDPTGPRRVDARALGEQAATVLAGRLATEAGKTLRNFGIDEVRIQPELVAREGNPGARFTFGKRLTSYARLVVSRGLQSAEESYFQLDAEPGLHATVSVRRLDDGEYVFGVGQRLGLGGPPHRSTRDERVVVSAFRIDNAPPALATSLRAAVRLRPGSRASFWKVQEAADRMQVLLLREHYIEAEVSGRLTNGEAVFSVRSGPRYRVAVGGLDDPPDLWPEVTRALFEEEAIERGRVRLLRTLHARGHYHARVEAAARSEGPERVISFVVRPGARFDECRVLFPGARSLSTGRLLKAAGGSARIVAQPETVPSRIEALYLRERFLRAKVLPPRIVEGPRGLLIEVAVDEGTRARIASVVFAGTDVSVERLAALADIQPGTLYEDATILAAMERLRRHFLPLGYANVRVSPRLADSNGDLELLFEIDPGPRFLVGELEIRGAEGRIAHRIRRSAPFKAGKPLDPLALARYESRLLAMGGLARASVRQGPGNPATIIIDVERAARAELRYDVHYGDADGFGGMIDAEARDIAELVTVGGRYRQAADAREMRGSLYIPGRGLTASLFRLSEDLPSQTGTNRRVQDGAQLQQSLRLPARWHLLLGYRFKRVTLTDFAPVDFGAADLTVLRETRDNPLNPRRGALVSLNVELAHPRLASHSSFIKGFAQASFTDRIASRLIWAHAYRVGLAHTFDDEPLLASERFKAGGANSLRGFRTEGVGPQDYFGTATGGQAVFVVNQELRYMHARGVGLAAFYDVGNVFARLGDIRLSGRHTLGVGLRWDSPLGLLRFDLGRPLAPRAGERRLQTYFSLGQAF